MNRGFFRATHIKKRPNPLGLIPARSLSLFVCLSCWLLLSALTVFIIRGMEDMARLIRDNDNERIFNMLFTGLRDHDNFGSAIEANPAISERINGFAVYDGALLPVFSWGNVPPVFDESILEKKMMHNRFGRFTIPDKKNGSIKFVFRAETPRPMPRHGMRMRMHNMEQAPLPFFNTLVSGIYYYIDISHPDYWRTITLNSILLPVCCLVLLGVVFYFRHLYLRNLEYRERIEGQKNLVVLGTAAGTLAHEIKTPLSSIRLQTGILEKIYAGQGAEEISIINEEIDRLSSLSRRINDYLREGKGDPSAVNLYELIRETGIKLCGRDILTGDSLREAWIFADPERIRSVFENLIRNALESGGPMEAAEVFIRADAGNIAVHVRDRGKGIAESDLGRIFDLFFTRKSSGTGIGLSICKRFIEAAGGSISLKNRNPPGSGAEASAIFPEYTLKEGGT